MGGDSFLRWLGAITRNVLAREARGKKISLDLDLSGREAGPGTSPSRLVRRDERFDRLQEALCRLTPEQREAIHLSRMEGLKIREILQSAMKG